MTWTKEKPTREGWYAVTTALDDQPRLRYLVPKDNGSYFDKSGSWASECNNYDKYFYLGDEQVSEQKTNDLYIALWTEEGQYGEDEQGFATFRNEDDLKAWLKCNYTVDNLKIFSAREIKFKREVVETLEIIK